MIAVGPVRASEGVYLRSYDRYFRFALAVAGRFLPAGFFAVLADFLGDLRVGLSVDCLVEDDRLLPEKMFSQLSEYFLVAPRRTTLMVELCSLECVLDLLIVKLKFGVGAAANGLAVLKFFIAETMWFVCAGAESFVALLFVGLEVAFAPVNVAIAFECEDMRRQAV
jgi:hypothetical protein